VIDWRFSGANEALTLIFHANGSPRDDDVAVELADAATAIAQARH
jgi:hypothetical protein